MCSAPVQPVTFGWPYQVPSVMLLAAIMPGHILIRTGSLQQDLINYLADKHRRGGGQGHSVAHHLVYACPELGAECRSAPCLPAAL